MSTKPLLKQSLFVLNICGINPIYQNKWTNIKATAIVALLTYVTTEIFFYCLFSWRSWDSADEFIMLYKAVFTKLKKKDLAVVLHSTGQFWCWENLPVDIHQEIKYICKYTLTSLKLFGMSCFTTLALYVVKPLFVLPLRTLPYGTYNPTDCNVSPNYQLMYILQACTGTLGAFCIIGFDSLFISLVVHVICELKILKKKFSDVKVNVDVKGDERSCLKEINKLVEHHNFVLGVIKNIDKLYSVFLLNQFSSSIFCVCSALLTVAASDFPPDLQHFSICVSFLLAALSQLLIYCFVGEYLIGESESLSDAVFESDWWVKTQPKLRKSYVMIIRRAQKTEKLSAGNMVILNLLSFTSIMRFSLSFFAMTQALYTRKSQRAANFGY